MKKIVWVACDLDGTLLKFDNQFHIIVPEAITAIWNLIKNNIVFTIVTGRWHTDALKIYNSYQLHDKCRYLVACNGGIIYDTYQKEIITKVFLNQKNLEITDGIINYLTDKNYKFIAGAYRLDGSIVFNKMAKNYPRMVNNFMIFEGDFSKRQYFFTDCFKEIDQYLKVVFFFENNDMYQTNFVQLKHDLLMQFNILNDQLVCTGIASLEYLPKGVSKGQALQKLSKLLDISLDRALSIGDSENDISMFKLTRYSATLKSSAPTVKNHATHVFDTDASVVVADAINLLVLNHS